MSGCLVQKGTINAREEGDELCWVNAADCTNPTLVDRVLRLVATRARSFQQPTTGYDELFRTGAMTEKAVEARKVLVHAKTKVVPWEQVLERANRGLELLREEGDRRAAAAGANQTRVARIRHWQAALRPLELEEIEPELQGHCYEALDKRLWRVPFPFVPPVHSAPLAPLSAPPPLWRVPQYATDWEHVLTPPAPVPAQVLHSISLCAACTGAA